MSPLSPLSAVAFASLNSATFIVLLYVLSPVVNKVPLPRNHPLVVKRRIIGVVISCCFSIWLTLHIVGGASSIGLYSTNIVKDTSIVQTHTPLEKLGLRKDGFISAFFEPLAVTAALFFGPLVHRCLDGTLLSSDESAFSLLWWRNYVVVNRESRIRAHSVSHP